MAMHLSVRLAWHMNGWNGRVCQDPAANSYCVGQHSYPGEMIREQRDLSLEIPIAGQACPTGEGYIPPCVYGINAFGADDLAAYAHPPDFFQDGTKTRRWALPASTVCIWPYEVMYTDDVRRGERSYDYEKRLANANKYFAQFAPDKSLIIYYANYSNPFSEEERRKYVIVGISRLRALGETLFYENTSDRVKERYGGGFVWQMNVTSHYPSQGMRIPYHKYLDQPEILDQLAIFPENPRNFKYATREISDDGTLSIVERFLEVAAFLRDLDDDTEDWGARLKWLQSVIAELWIGRGLYPGLPKVLDYLEFQPAINWFVRRAEAGEEKEAKKEIFEILEGASDSGWAEEVPFEDLQRVQRQWALRQVEEQHMLKSTLPRMDLEVDQIEGILSTDRQNRCSISATLEEISQNPYLLSEQYVGMNADDQVSFRQIDHGMLPSPDLGGLRLADKDDWRRLRAVCVQTLKSERKHTFISTVNLLEDVNVRLKHLPDWKRQQFTDRYFEVDREGLAGALLFREIEDSHYVYLNSVYEDERAVEERFRELANRPGIALRSPMTIGNWHDFLFEPQSQFAAKQLGEYEEIISGQAEVCHQIFTQPLSVISGAAGTGKTTVIKAIIRAIEKAHGGGATFQLLAPTGKAADRMREATGKSASTLHSFLTSLGWLNENFTFKRVGGQREDTKNTLIVDEASMVDLELMAALIRSINWNSVQRLILVGDPSQLPPIGRGRVFADLIDWMGANHPISLGELNMNIRHLENRLENRGTGILDLASVYVRVPSSSVADLGHTAQAEAVLKRVQDGGEVDRDLRVIFWTGQDDLFAKLTETMVGDMVSDTGNEFDPDRPFEIWNQASQGNDGQRHPENQQVLSPYRGEAFGIDSLNQLLQEHAQGNMLNRIGTLDGITLFDKVIQFRNRGLSNPLWAYSLEERATEPVEIFNGELGFVKPHPFDKGSWKGKWFNFRRFQVEFARKPGLWVGYGSGLGKKPNGKFVPRQRVEENLELAYAISVHKSQGSEFRRIYFVVPKHKRALLSRELFYTGITRARTHCTLLIEEDISPLLAMRRLEASHILGIHSSLFEFREVPDEFLKMHQWYEEGKIHRALTGEMVRSKSEVIIANMLHQHEIPFRYEIPLYAPDGTFYLPDFTLSWRGQEWYWEHLGMLSDEDYRNHWNEKEDWYRSHGFHEHLITSEEAEGFDSQVVESIMQGALRI